MSRAGPTRDEAFGGRDAGAAPAPDAAQRPAARDGADRLQSTLGNRLVARLAGAPPAVQRLAEDERTPEGRAVRRAEAGVRGPGARYPHRERIQAAFGRHALDGLRAHVDADARSAARELRARAYTIGRDVAFAEAEPALHVAAHEAAHFVQQAAGVRLSGGVGRADDPHEAQAERVAEAVVEGRSAEAILDRIPTAPAAGSAGVQLLGESAAIKYVHDAGIHRGNRRASIIATEGRSYAKHGFIVEKLWRDNEFTGPVFAAIEAAHPELKDNASVKKWTNAHAPNLNRYAVEALKAGNCGQFADVTTSVLIETTEKQWVHKAGLSGKALGDNEVDFDHGFVLTAPERLPTFVPEDRLPGDSPRLLPDLENQVEIDKVTVADAWDNETVVSLRKFVGGANCYDKKLSYADIQILFAFEAQGQEKYDALYPPALRKVIREGALAAHQRNKLKKQYQQDKQTLYERQKELGRGFAKDGGGGIWDTEHDGQIHVSHEDAARLWEETRAADPWYSSAAVTEAFARWAQDEAGTIDWSRAESARAALSYLVEKGGALRARAYALIDPAALPAEMSGEQIWTYTDHQNLRTPEHMSRLVAGLTPRQLAEIRTHVMGFNWTRHVLPHLTQAQRKELGLDAPAAPPDPKDPVASDT